MSLQEMLTSAFQKLSKAQSASAEEQAEGQFEVDQTGGLKIKCALFKSNQHHCYGRLVAYQPQGMANTINTTNANGEISSATPPEDFEFIRFDTFFYCVGNDIIICYGKGRMTPKRFFVELLNSTETLPKYEAFKLQQACNQNVLNQLANEKLDEIIIKASISQAKQMQGKLNKLETSWIASAGLLLSGKLSSPQF